VEGLEVVEPLAHADELDRFAEHGAQAQGRAAARVTVQLRERQPREPQAAIELLVPTEPMAPARGLPAAGVDGILDAMSGRPDLAGICFCKGRPT
jgi:hypothetical protein